MSQSIHNNVNRHKSTGKVKAELRSSRLNKGNIMGAKFEQKNEGQLSNASTVGGHKKETMQCHRSE